MTEWMAATGPLKKVILNEKSQYSFKKMNGWSLLISTPFIIQL